MKRLFLFITFPLVIALLFVLVFSLLFNSIAAHRPKTPKVSIVADCVDFSKDGKWIAYGSHFTEDWKSCFVKICDGNSGSLVYNLAGHTGNVYDVEFSPDNTLLASGGLDGRVILFDTKTWRPKYSFCLADSITSLSFSRDGNYLAAGQGVGKNCEVWIYQVASQNVVSVLHGHSWSIHDLAFFNNSKMIVTTCDDPDLLIWDVMLNKIIRRIRCRQPISPQGVFSIKLSPDGMLLASGAGKGIVQFWNISSWKEVATIQVLPESVKSLSFSPSGKFIAIGTECDVTIWDLIKLERVSDIQNPPGAAKGVNFSPDGKMLTTGALDSQGNILMWKISAFFD